jgi:hypothetical protein
MVAVGLLLGCCWVAVGLLLGCCWVAVVFAVGLVCIVIDILAKVIQFFVFMTHFSLLMDRLDSLYPI